jgi:hypothetical protein
VGSDLDILLGIAEIAVAFAGFAAIAGVIGRRQRGSEQHDFERLRGVVLASIVVVVAALVPIVLSRFDLPESTTWRLASGAALVLNLWGLAQVIRGGRRSGLHRADRFYTSLAYSIEVPLECVLIANVFALFPAHLAALYLTFLVLLLCQAAVVFVALLASLFDPDLDAHDGD